VATAAPHPKNLPLALQIFRPPHKGAGKEMKCETLIALNDARRAGRAIVRATDLQTGEEKLIDPATDTSPLGLAAAGAARADTSGPAILEDRNWFLAVYNPPLDLAIIGAVHIAQPLAQMAAIAGYGVRIIDPRTAFATAERFPGVTLSHDWPDEALGKAPLGLRSAIVALAHDPKLDDPALTIALRSACFYIGALGSKKTHAARLARLKEHGFSDDDLAKIHGPIGLAIGGRSPAEIAISILAEMTQKLRAGGSREHSAAHASA
jgi:xanthine dehydrogenase accessory factor